MLRVLPVPITRHHSTLSLIEKGEIGPARHTIYHTSQCSGGSHTVGAIGVHKPDRIYQLKYLGGGRELEAKDPAGEARPGEIRNVEVTRSTSPHPKGNGSGEQGMPSKQALLRI